MTDEPAFAAVVKARAIYPDLPGTGTVVGATVPAGKLAVSVFQVGGSNAMPVAWNRGGRLIESTISGALGFVASNDNGQVVGVGPAGTTRWNSGGMVEQVFDLQALGMNGNGDVAGVAPDVSNPSISRAAARWEDGTVRALSDGGAVISSAQEISPAGAVIGEAIYGSAAGLYAAAIYWPPGSADPVEIGPNITLARGMNDLGEVVAYHSSLGLGIWTASDGFMALGYPGAIGVDIDNHGRIVGSLLDGTAVQPFVWTPVDGLVLLETPNGSGGEAHSISDAGVITGTSQAHGPTVWILAGPPGRS